MSYFKSLSYRHSQAWLAGFWILLLLPTHILLPVQLWDESRVLVNALEMGAAKNFLVPTYMGVEDVWNTKPPLLTALMAALSQIFPLSLALLRSPVLLATIGLALLLHQFLYRQTRSLVPGFLASFILLTSSGFFGVHAAFTVDFDVPLVFFMILFLVNLYDYFETPQIRSAILAGAGLTGALLVKGVVGLSLGPAVVLYLMLFKRSQLTNLMKQFSFYLIAILPIAVLALYYIYRNSLNPDFISILNFNEWGGRAMGYSDQSEGFWFYLAKLSDSRMIVWLHLIPFLYFFFLKNSSHIQVIKFFLIQALMFFLIVSASQTKNTWYILPCIVFLVPVVATGLWELYRSGVFWPWKLRWRILFIGLLLTPLGPVLGEYKLLVFPQIELSPTSSSDFVLKEALSYMKKNSIPRITILVDRYDAPSLASVMIFNQQHKEYKLELKSIEPLVLSEIQTRQLPMLDETDRHIFVYSKELLAQLEKLQNWQQVQTIRQGYLLMRKI